MRPVGFFFFDFFFYSRDFYRRVCYHSIDKNTCVPILLAAHKIRDKTLKARALDFLGSGLLRGVIQPSSIPGLREVSNLSTSVTNAMVSKLKGRKYFNFFQIQIFGFSFFCS